MRLTRTFSAPVPEPETRQRAAAFLTQAGYRQSSDSGGVLHFRRGSLLGTLTNFDPTRWASEVNLRISDHAGECEIIVDAAIANDPFEKHFAEELLTAEFGLLKAALATGKVGTLDVRDLRRRISSHVYHVVGLFGGFILSVVLGIAASTFALARLDVAPPAAWGIGAGLFLVLAGICLVAWRRASRAAS